VIGWWVGSAAVAGRSQGVVVSFVCWPELSRTFARTRGNLANDPGEEIRKAKHHQFLGPGGPDDPFADDPFDD
jgi:hypothetical protein